MYQFVRPSRSRPRHISSRASGRSPTHPSACTSTRWSSPAARTGRVRHRRPRRRDGVARRRQHRRRPRRRALDRAQPRRPRPHRQPRSRRRAVSERHGRGVVVDDRAPGRLDRARPATHALGRQRRHASTSAIGRSMFKRPPIFDSPTTRAVFDPSTGLIRAGDLGAALGPDAGRARRRRCRPTSWRRASSSPTVGSARGSSMVDDAKYSGRCRSDRRPRRSRPGCRPTDRCTKAATSTGRSNCCARYRPPATSPQPGQSDLDAIVAAALVAA